MARIAGPDRPRAARAGRRGHARRRARRGARAGRRVPAVSGGGRARARVTGPADRGALPRRLGFWSAVAVLVGSTIGSGIFRSPAGIADKLPGPLPLAAVWVTGGLFALCGALTLAEVGSAFPETGGVYVFIREAFGRLPAFLFGWSELTVIRAASLGAIAITFAEYALRVAGFDPALAPYDAYAHYVAAAGIALLGLVNIRGVRWSALVLNTTTAGQVWRALVHHSVRARRRAAAEPAATTRRPRRRAVSPCRRSAWRW